jgi:hypothetical protein
MGQFLTHLGKMLKRMCSGHPGLTSLRSRYILYQPRSAADVASSARLQGRRVGMIAAMGASYATVCGAPSVVPIPVVYLPGKWCRFST